MPDVDTGTRMRCMGYCHASLVGGACSSIWLSCRQMILSISISCVHGCTVVGARRVAVRTHQCSPLTHFAERYIQAVIRMCDGSVLAATECERLHKDAEQYRFTFNACLRCAQRNVHAPGTDGIVLCCLSAYRNG
jgi:hypothetical protein